VARLLRRLAVRAARPPAGRPGPFALVACRIAVVVGADGGIWLR